MNAWKQFALWSLSLSVLALAPIGAAWAQVQVTAADPSSTLQGTVSLDVTISGNGFDSTANVNFLVTGTTDTGGIAVRKVSVRNSKKLVATIDVADTAVVNKFDIVVALSDGRKGKGTTLFAVQAKTGACTGATAAFVYQKSSSLGFANRTLYLSNDAGTCKRLLYTFNTGYDHYSSFRIVDSGAGQDGRVVTTEGGSDLLLIRFPIGPDMQVDPASILIQRIFEPLQDGAVDVTSFDLAADGHRLAYVTHDEDGGTTFLTRLRYINDVDACVPATPGALACRYDVGPLLAEHNGLSYVLDAPRWNTDGSWIYLEDRRGVFRSPYISRVSPQAPLPLGTEPEIVMGGNALRLFELRSRGAYEVMVYGESGGTGCRDVRVVLTSSCGGGSCATQVNSTAPRVQVSLWATVQSINSTSTTILVDGGTVDRKGNCSSTGDIARAVDSPTTGVQITPLIGNARGAAAK